MFKPSSLPPIPQATAFTLKANGILNVLITEVRVHIPGSAQNTTITAIWDTGATGTAISNKVVATLGLLPSGAKEVHTANGKVIQNTYFISIGLPNNVIVRGIEATEVPSLSGGCDALIGMDVISMGDFSITNLNGETCMSFRLPSLHEIDYVKDPTLQIKPPILHPPKIGRNDRCFCGSGKKYKHCHGKGA